MRIKSIVCGLCLIGTTVLGQVGTWQAQFKGIGQKAIGFGYMTFNSDGSMTGYNMATGLFGVGAMTGTWSVADSVITVSFTEGTEGQSETGTIVAKLKATSMRGTTYFQDGSRYSLRAAPGTPTTPGTGTFSGLVKSGHTVESETFTSTADSTFPGVSDTVGTVNGEAGYGQAIEEPNGIIIGYGIVEIGVDETLGTAFTGKYNARTGKLTTKGVDQDGDKVSSVFQKE